MKKNERFDRGRATFKKKKIKQKSYSQKIKNCIEKFSRISKVDSTMQKKELPSGE